MDGRLPLLEAGKLIVSSSDVEKVRSYCCAQSCRQEHNKHPHMRTCKQPPTYFATRCLGRSSSSPHHEARFWLAQKLTALHEACPPVFLQHSRRECALLQNPLPVYLPT